jgi:RNA 2',3'-cyclic 3'-phosphodiesterase
MPSYFLIIPLPDEVKDRLVAVQPRDLPSMRLAGRQEMHLTLYSLGELSLQYDEAVRKALARVKVNAFTITISGVGKFQLEGEPQVLWAGVKEHSCLFALHYSIGTVLADAIGFRPEERPYSPHITLARLDEPAPPEAIDRYLEENRGFVIPAVQIDRFILYSSRLVENIPKYQEEAAFSLRHFGPKVSGNPGKKPV